ncbi:ribose transport system permease protein [Labrenzia sp. EL_208]|uniref:D-allose transport system permease protein AlsC n=1 Tax=Roseibium album TaxID=311410 RepID=A0A0M6ZGM0_9HYPH|nr:ABC transporter permease [Roseibium album]MBG6146749.1 ribose transport system permease protein [Labrenzia sp. EL_142]MBG6155815.1 ribose transport system permease protein [Labrenzia sp. EL_162]MBG6161270.1 ribose transport system permease protein [Labrenzia sp. EL_195]MBG6177202.1 ribose transport system permease protein [Labrenzia sp. EL_132]MBG6194349.1 ribose transport system permease protein [Labrenzia sp. EL_159]MBG6231823.1 ribose transport system permease protein [Labrenzia sp. EL_
MSQIENENKTGSSAIPKQGRRFDPIQRFLLSNEFGLIVLIVVFAIIFSTVSPMFLSKFSLYALGRTSAVNIMIGFSMMIVIVTGGLNLAVGAIGVCAAMAGGWLMQAVGLHWLPALMGGLAIGGLLGAVNGVLIVRSGLHSFVITLATMSIMFGVMIFLTQAESYREISPAFTAFGRMKLWGVIPPMLLVTIGIGILLWVLFVYSSLGRQILAAGASPAAAELSGIHVDRMIVWCHGLSGVLAGVAGFMLVSRTGAAIPSMAGQLGQDWLLPAFLAPVLGGTLLTGGRVSVLGTLLGGFLVTMLTSGLLLMQVGAFWMQTYLGLLLLLAVLLDLARRSYLSRNKLV